MSKDKTKAGINVMKGKDKIYGFDTWRFIMPNDDGVVEAYSEELVISIIEKLYPDTPYHIFS